MDNIKIGQFIKTCRKEMQLTQEQLAEKLNVSKNAVSKWERGICLMDVSLLKPLSQIFGITVTELLNGEKMGDAAGTKSEKIVIDTNNYKFYKNRKKENLYILIIFCLSIIFIVLLNMIQKNYSGLLESVFISVLGFIFIFLGIINFKGKITSIHWYHRRNIRNENVIIYGKLMGIGTAIIGIGMLVAGLIRIFYESEIIDYIIVAGLVVGIVIMLYAQIRYNKGIF